MEEIYQQKCGKVRIVRMKGWNKRDALIEDIKSSLMYAVSWDTFSIYYEKVEPYECNVEDYKGCDLSKLIGG